MGLDVVMLGGNEIDQESRTDPVVSLLIQCLIHFYPDQAADVDFGRCPSVVSDGHRVGGYSDLHVLRGLAIATETRRDEIESLCERDLVDEAERFYGATDQVTCFPHLINHADDSGFYVPFNIPEPVAFEAPIGEDGRPVALGYGSCNQLLAELIALNDLLKMPGDAGELDPRRLNEVVSSHRWPVAAHVWAVLHLYAREASDKNLIIRFC